MKGHSCCRAVRIRNSNDLRLSVGPLQPGYSALKGGLQVRRGSQIFFILGTLLEGVSVRVQGAFVSAETFAYFSENSLNDQKWSIFDMLALEIEMDSGKCKDTDGWLMGSTFFDVQLTKAHLDAVQYFYCSHRDVYPKVLFFSHF